MVFYSKQIKDYNHYYKVQGAEYNFDYSLGTEIQSEELEFEKDEGECQEVFYESKTYATTYNGIVRVTTRDKAHFKYPHFKYHVVTYDELSSIGYYNLRATTSTTFDKVRVGINEYAVVYFHFQTGGFNCNDDILQISMKSGTREFHSYVDPTQDVSQPATERNGLTAEGDDLFRDNERVKSLPLELVLLKVLYYLNNFDNKKCILVAHNNFGFDMPRLLRAIKKFNLLSEFENIIEGFCSTLELFQENFPNEPNGYSFRALMDRFNIVYYNAYDSKHDVHSLEKLTNTALGLNEIAQSYKPLDDCLFNFHRNELAREIKPSYAPMGNVISKKMIDRLAKAGISYDDIVERFTDRGERKTASLLRKAIIGSRVVNNILKYLRENHEEYENSDDSYEDSYDSSEDSEEDSEESDEYSSYSSD